MLFRRNELYCFETMFLKFLADVKMMRNIHHIDPRYVEGRPSPTDFVEILTRTKFLK